MSQVAEFDRLDLPVSGMSCSGCVRAVERSLNRLDGVHASVNLATETAAVLYDATAIAPADLVGAVRSAGYGAEVPDRQAGAHHRPDDAAALRRRLNVAGSLATAFTVSGYVPRLRTRRWEQAYLATAVPIVLWGGAPFHVRAAKSLRRGTSTMDTLVSAGSLIGLATGVVGTLRGTPRAYRYLDVATGVVVSMLSGRMLEAQARGEAGGAIRALLQAGPREASRLDEQGAEERVPADQLKVGDRFLVRPGEAVATDGVVDEGSSAVDQSLLTGESVPVEVGPGDAVAGGAVNAGGPLVIRATQVGADTSLARIARLVADAQLGKAPVQRVADRIASVFVPAVMVLAAGTLGVRLRRGVPAGEALEPALSVLVVACPCALGLATPAALMVGVGRGAQLGIFIRSPDVLESAHAVDVILLDKTGTVTTGAMGLVDITADGATADEALGVAAAVEDASEHPIARAIAAAGKERLGELPPVTGFRAATGFGVEGVVEGREVRVGRPAFHDVEVPAALQEAIARAEDAGRIAVVAAWDGRARAVLEIADEVRPTSAEAVSLLRGLGLRPILLTGDQERTARAVANAVGIDEVIAGALPGEKAAVVARLQAEGHKVAVAGDGINDAPALAAADLGLAVGSGTDAAIQASDLTLASADLRAAADAIRLARATFTAIRGNLRWAAAYNLVALPVAASGRLKPVMASMSMTASSLFVVLNSLRLRKFEAQRDLSPAHTGASPDVAPGQ